MNKISKFPTRIEAKELSRSSGKNKTKTKAQILFKRRKRFTETARKISLSVIESESHFDLNNLI